MLHPESAARAATGPAPDAAPWPDLDGLPGVSDAVAAARSAIAAVQRLPANRRGWARTAAAAAVRAARASAVLDGGSVALGAGGAGAAFPGPGTPGAAAAGAATVGDEAAPGIVTDPILAGALRANSAIGELAAVWRRAPLQALARLHTLAAADLVAESELGRPRAAPGLTRRLATMAEVATRSPWSGPVTVAVVHGELLTLQPFGSANGVVARAAARLAMVTSGLDPQALTAPEVGNLRAGVAYREGAAAFAGGDPAGVAGWITFVCRSLRAGADEARSIARAAGG